MHLPTILVRFARPSTTMALWGVVLTLAACQSSTKAPPPGETPQAVSPVAIVPISPVAPAVPPSAPAGAQAPAQAPAEAAKPAAVVPQLPGAVKVHNLAETTKAQCAIVGLGVTRGQVKGSVVLEELADGGVSIKGTVSGLTPGRHGFHVHEHGNCHSADGLSAGGHFNPTNAPHGATEATHSHVGDLGNIVADASGRAVIDLVKKPATLKAGPSSFLGRSLIVHAAADDLKSQPAGGSGSRVGCGVIKPMT
jgi:Cu-Zn family superoxide dismutase